MVKERDLLTITLACMLFFSLFFISNPIDVIKAGEIITVGPGGSYNFTTIQDAIEYADPGDTINVYSGTYNENLIIVESIEIISIYGSSNTIINGAHTNKQTINADDANNVIIEGFTIKNSVGANKEYACILFEDVTNGEINNNEIKNGKDGVQLIGSTSITINENIIEDNSGHGINLEGSDNNIISKNEIKDNSENGILLSASSSNTIKENTIHGNIVYGLRTSYSDDNTIYLNTFSENSDNNAIDTSTNNWYYNSQGNYWDDYADYDKNPKDGIGDSPYDIPGGSNQDLYPLGFFLQINPVAQILSISPNPAIVGQAIHFEGNTIYDGTIDEWLWKINGVNRGISEDFDISEGLSSGTYSVTFQVCDGDLCSNVVSETLTVNPSSSTNQKPIVTKIQATPTQTTYGKTIYFFGEGSDEDSGDTIDEYEWISNRDGALSNQKSFSTKQLSIGTHAISLRVKDNHGAWSNPLTLTITINSDPLLENNPPVADAGGPYSGIVDVTSTFNGSNSYDEDEGDNITNYYWDFGDGNTSNGETVEHIYDSAAQYNVTLTVTDSNGEQSQDITYIIIEETSNNQTSDGDNEKIVIPGFEIIFLFIASIIIIIKKKKNLG